MQQFHVNMGKNRFDEEQRFEIKVTERHVFMTVQSFYDGSWHSSPDEGTGFSLEYAKEVIAALTLATSDGKEGE